MEAHIAVKGRYFFLLNLVVSWQQRQQQQQQQVQQQLACSAPCKIPVPLLQRLWGQPVMPVGAHNTDSGLLLRCVCFTVGAGSLACSFAGPSAASAAAATAARVVKLQPTRP
jgi:hypothetical protein